MLFPESELIDKMDGLKRITVSERAEKEIKNGFPWAYDTEVTADERPEDGAVCLAYTKKGRYLAAGFFNSVSKLRFRVISRNANDTVDTAFWRRRAEWAVDYRIRVMGDDLSCCRLIFGDADGFPGLTVDRYEDVLCVEVNCLGMDRQKETVISVLLDVLAERGIRISSVMERSEGRNRELEGLADSVGYMELPGYGLTEKRNVTILKYDIRSPQVAQC